MDDKELIKLIEERWKESLDEWKRNEGKAYSRGHIFPGGVPGRNRARFWNFVNMLVKKYPYGEIQGTDNFVFLISEFNMVQSAHGGLIPSNITSIITGMCDTKTLTLLERIWEKGDRQPEPVAE